MTKYFLAVHNPANAKYHNLDHVDGWYLIKIDRSATPTKGATWWTKDLVKLHTFIARRLLRSVRHNFDFRYVILEINDEHSN